MIDACLSLFDPSAVAAAERTPTQVAGLRRLLPSLSLNLAAKANYRRFSEILEREHTEPLVLSVGGGEGGAGSSRLGASIRQVVIDVAIGDRTDVAADAHRLPFADGTFDGVVAQAVLEHVVDPPACVAEIHRVLRPGGLVYAETPFMQQVHMGRYDFTRYTELGHRRLFRAFEELAAGPAVGPGSALAWSLTYFLASFAWDKKTRRALQAVGRFLFFWLRYADVLLRTDAAHDAAAGFYFIGRKTGTVLSDRDLVARYCGGIDL